MPSSGTIQGFMTWLLQAKAAGWSPGRWWVTRAADPWGTKARGGLGCGSFTPLHVDTRGRRPPSLQFRRHNTLEEKTSGFCAPVPGTADLHLRSEAVTFLTNLVRSLLISFSFDLSDNFDKALPPSFSM
ncbi:hypothetical protein E5288_WYG008922 [Bos mutus]|uniref:Uncharacterized protein n=1 Tax=Bos mutus TaxID=72004 RepID=A0A6B0QRP8_9CETA|nr:hypothetical protein [Bos mutus]